jgi:hypothetical protein
VLEGESPPERLHRVGESGVVAACGAPVQPVAPDFSEWLEICSQCIRSDTVTAVAADGADQGKPTE